ncbi:MAG: Regulator of ribonuclease [Actinomycetota bacterium]|jgi:hypothetical protein
MRDFSRANQLLISQRESAGDSLDSAHRLQHYCYFANQFMAQAADEAFRKAGFETVLLKATMKSQVMVMHWGRITETELNSSCDDIALIVEHYGGEYAGWDSPFIAA